LDKIIQGLKLVDVWNAPTNMQVYAHYTPTGAAGLDRIYATETIGKTNTE